MWSLSDESLLAGYAAGDATASAAFVRRFQARVFGLALTIVGNSAVAEEVAQEAFIRAFKHASAFDPRRARVATWLLSITRNLAIDALRVRRADPMDPDVIMALPLASQDASPEELGALAIDTQRLSAALADLPEPQRRVVVLASFYGRTAREISEMDGVPLGTVKTRIRTAMIALRKALETEGDETRDL
jgi:RNA polymerase sigma-70 factor (ECF subfamily)